MAAKIKTEDSTEILFLYFILHIHNPELHPFPSHRFPIPCKSKRRNTKSKFKKILLELVMKKVQTLPIFAYQPWSLLKQENKQISWANPGCKKLTAESLLERTENNA